MKLIINLLEKILHIIECLINLELNQWYYNQTDLKILNNNIFRHKGKLWGFQVSTTDVENIVFTIWEYYLNNDLANLWQLCSW